MASDNRAASALGRNYPGGLPAFVTAMNAKAATLGATQTHYVDSSGLSPSNVSTPADLGKLVAAAARYPMITEYTTTGAVNVTLPDSKRKLSFVNTNALVRSSDWKIGLSKTGYINEAGKCLVMQAMIANQPIVIVLLDSWGRLTRVADANNAFVAGLLSSGTLLISEFNGGSFTTRASTPFTVDTSTPYTMTLNAAGSVLTASCNGTQVQYTISGSFAGSLTATKVGMRLRNNMNFDNCQVTIP